MLGKWDLKFGGVKVVLVVRGGILRSTTAGWLVSVVTLVVRRELDPMRLSVQVDASCHVGIFL